MGEKRPDIFQHHSRNYLEMALSTERQEIMTRPDGYGKRTGECGDTVEIYLKVRREKIGSISYSANGCINTHACCNTVARMAEGMDVNTAWEITPEKVIDYLETLPPDHTHCAELAVGALYLALSHYQQLERNPWKKSYQ